MGVKARKSPILALGVGGPVSSLGVRPPGHDLSRPAGCTFALRAGPIFDLLDYPQGPFLAV